MSRGGYWVSCERHIRGSALGTRYAVFAHEGDRMVLVKSNQVKRMAEQCIKKQGSNPPICGVHNAQLVQTEVRIDQYAPHTPHNSASCLRCPVSGAVISDDKAK
jgi:hypothetical protein